MRPPFTLLVGAVPTQPGDEGFYRQLMDSASHVVAVDGGADLCLRCDRSPDVVLGDMDSVQLEVLEHFESEGVPIRRFPTDKDVTDLDLALAEVARSSHSSEVVLTACLGARVDHTLATIGSMASHSDLRPVAVEPDQTCWLLASSARDSILLPPPGTSFSIIALEARALVSVAGVRYPLIRQLLNPLSSLGVSNIVTEEHAAVQVDMGKILIVVPEALGWYARAAARPEGEDDATGTL